MEALKQFNMLIFYLISGSRDRKSENLTTETVQTDITEKNSTDVAKIRTTSRRLCERMLEMVENHFFIWQPSKSELKKLSE